MAPAVLPTVRPFPWAIAGLDAAIAIGIGVGAWSLLPGLTGGATGGNSPTTFSGLAAGALLATGLIAPPTFISFLRDGTRLDSVFAASTGAVTGVALGFGALRLAGGTPDSLTQALAFGVAQGLLTSGAFHLYLAQRDSLVDRDKLPAIRTDDPMDNWNWYRDKRNNP